MPAAPAAAAAAAPAPEPAPRDYAPRHGPGAPPRDYQPAQPAVAPRPAAPVPPAVPAQPAQPAAAAAAVQAEMLPSVDRRPTARMPLPAKAMRIGRIPDNDLVLSDLNVSRHHAELRKSSTGSYEIVDLGSHNGTFVNGQRVTSQVLTEQDLVSIGSSTFRLTSGELRQFVDDGNITFTAQDLVVKAGSKVLLDNVHVPDPGKVPARRHRPQRRGQVHAARRADRDAPRDHRHGAVRQP